MGHDTNHITQNLTTEAARKLAKAQQKSAGVVPAPRLSPQDLRRIRVEIENRLSANLRGF